MFELVLLSAVGWLTLAAASARFRRDLGITGMRAIRGYRAAALALFVVAAIRAGAPLTGERWIRLLGAASIAAVLVTLGLSAFPAAMLRPVRLIRRWTRQG